MNKRNKLKIVSRTKEMLNKLPVILIFLVLVILTLAEMGTLRQQGPEPSLSPLGFSHPSPAHSGLSLSEGESVWGGQDPAAPGTTGCPSSPSPGPDLE